MHGNAKCYTSYCDKFGEKLIQYENTEYIYKVIILFSHLYCSRKASFLLFYMVHQSWSLCSQWFAALSMLYNNALLVLASEKKQMRYHNIEKRYGCGNVF